METKDNKKKIVDLLIENEAVMNQLYREFAKVFGLHEQFWKKISSEEESHAAWITTLYYKMGAGLVDFSEERFPVDAIKENIHHMREMIEKCKKWRTFLFGGS